MDNKKLLILDLDNTIAYSSSHEMRVPDFKFDVFGAMVWGRTRPGAVSFIRECSKHYHIGVYSAGAREYVHRVLEYIWPNDVDKRFVWTRDECTEDPDGPPVKSLACLLQCGDWTLDRMVVLDDTPEAYVEEHRGNVLRIRPFYGGTSDGELAAALRALQHISGYQDTRTGIVYHDLYRE